MNLEDYIEEVIERLDKPKSKAILLALSVHRELNMDQISIESKVNRSSLMKYIQPLELLGFVAPYKVGVSKFYKITELGKSIFEKHFN